jgi:hypothetical protein
VPSRHRTRNSGSARGGKHRHAHRSMAYLNINGNILKKSTTTLRFLKLVPACPWPCRGLAHVRNRGAEKHGVALRQQGRVQYINGVHVQIQPFSDNTIACRSDYPSSNDDGAMSTARLSTCALDSKGL